MEQKINYAGKDYVVIKRENDIYECCCGEEHYNINSRELEILKKMGKNIEKGEKKKEIVSFYNDRIQFNPFQYKPYLKLISKENEKQCIYIADEVGVGKTFEVGIIISELAYSEKINIRKPILIVCPNMLCKKWQEVIHEFFGFGSRIITRLSDISGISIISFDTISGIGEKEFENLKYEMLIVDEAHNVGVRLEKLLKIRRNSKYTVLLSATPLSGKDNSVKNQTTLLFASEESNKDFFNEESCYLNRTLKNQIREGKIEWHIENCEILYENSNNYLKTYCDIIEKIFIGKNTLKKFIGLNMIGSSPSAAKAYCRILSNLSFDEVKQLFISSHINKKDFKEKGYDSLEDLLNDYENLEDMKDIFDDVSEEIEEGTILNILEQIKKLGNEIDDNIQDEKLEKLKSIISKRKEQMSREDSNYFKKIIVFVNYNETATYLYKNINNSLVINGKVSKNEKLSRFKEFCNESSGKDVLIITNIACEGLDMDFCNAIVNYDLTYNPIQLAQRKGRIDRFNITCKEKYIYNFLNKDVDPQKENIEDFVINKENSIFNYNNSIYPILLRKLQKIKEQTGIYYNIIDTKGKTYESVEDTEREKEMAEEKLKDLFNTFYNSYDFQKLEDIKKYYEENYNKCYEKVNEQLKEKHVFIESKQEDISIRTAKNNIDFLKYVYDGGTINSHLIYNR